MCPVDSSIQRLNNRGQKVSVLPPLQIEESLAW